MKILLKDLGNNLGWVFLWYIINVLLFIWSGRSFGWGTVIIGLVTAIGIVAWINKDELEG